MRFSFWTGVNQNAYRGHYINGKEYNTLKKVEVEVVYWRLFVELKKAPENDIRILAIVSHFFIFVLYFSTAKKVV